MCVCFRGFASTFFFRASEKKKEATDLFADRHFEQFVFFCFFFLPIRSALRYDPIVYSDGKKEKVERKRSPDLYECEKKSCRHYAAMNGEVVETYSPPPPKKKERREKKKGRHTVISITRDYRHTLSLKSDLIQVRIRE